MKKKPLVAIFSNHDDDIYCFRKELIEAIKAEGYDVLISCPYGPKFELMDLSEYIYDNPEIDRRGTNPFTDIKLIKHYFSLLKKYKPDVVLTYSAKPNIYTGLCSHLLKIPYISNVTGFGSLLFKKGLKKDIIMSMYSFVMRRSHTVMFQNKRNMELAGHYKMINDNAEVIPGSGVNLEKFSVSDYPDGGDGITGKPVVFNYIGRIVHDKGVDDLLSAAEIIKKTHPETEFNLMGFIEPTESHYENDLAVLQDKGIINYLGSQKDVRPFINKSHATIHPSYGEGMCNSLLETASSGRPVITTNVQGCEDTVKNNISGFVYESGNVNDLCKCILKFLSLPNSERKKMGLEGRKFMESAFSREIVINIYLDKIKEITGDKK